MTMVLYRRWRVNARSLSMETPLRIAKDIPPVIHPMKNCDSLSLQYALNLPSSSAVLKATKNGWPSSPTRKSENARQKSNVNDVELSCLVLQITSIIVPLPKTAAKANSELTTHDIILKVPWLDCRQKTSRKKHVRFVSFLFRLLVAIDRSSLFDKTVFVCFFPCAGAKIFLRGSICQIKTDEFWVFDLLICFQAANIRAYLRKMLFFLGEIHLTAVLKFVLLLAHHLDYMQSSLLLESCCYIAILVYMK